MKPTICEHCQQHFASAEALEMHTHAKHTFTLEGLNKEERKQAREQSKQEQHEKREKLKKYKRFLLYGVFMVGALVLVYWISTLLASGGTYSKGQVHWHADLKLMVCGEKVPLPKPIPGSNAHGEPFIGTPLMHLHNEPQIHIEGTIKTVEEITLGKFMEAIGLRFTDNELLTYKNGDRCPNREAGKVKLFVNGQENPALSNKTIVDGEEYELRFE